MNLVHVYCRFDRKNVSTTNSEQLYVAVIYYDVSYAN
jgi:hypothetical protein